MGRAQVKQEMAITKKKQRKVRIKKRMRRKREKKTRKENLKIYIKVKALTY